MFETSTQPSSGGSFATLSGSPGDNAALASALGLKLAKAGDAFTGLIGAGFRDTSADFDVTLGFSSTSATLTAGRSLTIDVGNVAHTIALGTTAGTITFPNAAAVTVAGLQIANVFTSLQTITQGAANAGILASTGYSLTGSNATSMLSFAGTWNTSGVPTALGIDLIETAVGAGANYIRVRGGAGTDPVFSVFRNAANDIHLKMGVFSYSPVLKSIQGQWIVRRGDSAGGDLVGIGTSSDNLGVVSFGTGGYLAWGASAATASGAIDLIVGRKAAATLQLGADAAGVTNQMITAASRITSDGVGANLTLAGGNGRGGAGGDLVFATYTTGGAATIGTLTDRLFIHAPTGLLQFAGQTDSFPALKRSSAELHCRLADDSGYAAFNAASYSVGGTPGAVGGTYTLISSITVVNGIITGISGT